jgi:hypothetical protein
MDALRCKSYFLILPLGHNSERQHKNLWNWKYRFYRKKPEPGATLSVLAMDSAKVGFLVKEKIMDYLRRFKATHSCWLVWTWLENNRTHDVDERSQAMPQSLGGHPETQIGQKRVDTRRGRQTLSTLRIKRQQVEFIAVKFHRSHRKFLKEQA